MQGDRIVSETLDERIHVRRLDNGLPVYVMPKKDYNKKYATFATKYGSIDNRFEDPRTGSVVEVPDGIAHFLEHKLFEEEHGNIFQEFAELGASANAYTTYTSTTYLFSTTDNFYECLRILLGFVQRPYFTDENVEKEKGIIEQEIRMYEDMPEVRVGSNLMRALYHSHPVRIDVVGTVDSIRRITKEMLYLCYETFYCPENMAVFVVGAVEPERVFDEVAALVDGRDRARRGEIRRLYGDEPDGVKEGTVIQDMVVATPLIEIGFKDVAGGVRGFDLLKTEVASRVLLEALFGRGSDLYSELYEEGLVDEKFGAAYESELEFAGSFVGGESKDPEALHSRIMDHLSKAREVGLRHEDIERARRRMIGEFASLFNSPEKVSYRFNQHLFKGADLFSYMRALRELTPGTVERRLGEHLIDSRHAVSIIRPR
ncbi:MAG: insulinase family protein [Firmicutes bacterium]|nr:insulinase family protein [Bacillota bacterium]